jgi:Tfp pilus assembly major pilin PilA
MSTNDQAGLTLIEVMVALLIIMIAMLGLMKVAAVATQSNIRGQRMTQAAAKAQARFEALKGVPKATLDCLAGGSTPATCVASCQAAGGETEACKLALAVAAGDDVDSTNTQYAYGYLVNVVPGAANTIYDVTIVVSYQDDSAYPPRTVQAVFRSAID